MERPLFKYIFIGYIFPFVEFVQQSHIQQMAAIKVKFLSNFNIILSGWIILKRKCKKIVQTS